MSLLDQATLELGVDNWGKGSQKFGVPEGDPVDLLASGDLGRWDDWTDENGETRLGMGNYCARDTGFTHLLYEKQRLKLREQQPLAKLMKHLVLPGVAVYAKMEANGIYVHWDRVDERERELQERVAYLTNEILTVHVSDELRGEWEGKAAKTAKKGEDPKGILQNEHFLRAWLFGPVPVGLGLTPTTLTDKTRVPAVGEDVLVTLDHPAPKLLVEVKKATKNLQFFSQWRDWRGDDGRLHPYFNLTGTVTGRRSCGNPNLQQVPRDRFMRTCLGAPDGWLFLEVDFSQLEVRIAAWFAEDDEMLRVFADPKGDIYRYTAARLAGVPESEVTKDLRQKAKAVVLGFLYGMGARAFRQYALDTYGVYFTDAEAREYRDGFFRLFPGLVRYHERQRRKAKAHLEVESPVGRLRHLMDVLSFDDAVRGKAERQAINSPIQGFGGDLTLMALIELDGILDPAECLYVGDIHDAVLFQVRADVWRRVAGTILTVMENPRLLQTFQIKPPVRFVAEGKIGDAWGAGTEFRLHEVDTVEVTA